jgi:hypothetical protein
MSCASVEAEEFDHAWAGIHVTRSLMPVASPTAFYAFTIPAIWVRPPKKSSFRHRFHNDGLRLGKVSEAAIRNLWRLQRRAARKLTW